KTVSRGHWRKRTQRGGASSCCARFSRLGGEGTSLWQPQRVVASAFFRNFPEASLLEGHPPSEAPSQTPGPSSSRIAALSAPQNNSSALFFYECRMVSPPRGAEDSLYQQCGFRLNTKTIPAFRKQVDRYL
ncbi:hypothetical protein JEQ12_019681, partial [Ovis aries]